MAILTDAEITHSRWAVLQVGNDVALDKLPDLIARPAWHARAACRGHDPALFFPTRGEATEPARRICADCPVRDECREEGVRYDERGVWGGTSERERRAIRKDQGRKIEARAPMMTGVRHDEYDEPPEPEPEPIKPPAPPLSADEVAHANRTIANLIALRAARTDLEALGVPAALDDHQAQAVLAEAGHNHELDAVAKAQHVRRDLGL